MGWWRECRRSAAQSPAPATPGQRRSGPRLLRRLRERFAQLRHSLRGLKAHLGFGLAFGCIQLVYQLLLSDLLPAPHFSREKTVVIFDAGGINDANPSASMDLSTPLHVSTFGPDGKRTDNDWEKAKRKQRKEQRKVEKQALREKKAAKEWEAARQKEREEREAARRPPDAPAAVPPPDAVAAGEAAVPHDEEDEVEVLELDEEEEHGGAAVAAAVGGAGGLGSDEVGACAPNATDNDPMLTPAAEPFAATVEEDEEEEPPPPPSEPPEPPPSREPPLEPPPPLSPPPPSPAPAPAPSPALEDRPAAAAGGGGGGGGEVGSAPSRRASYVWAQNKSHVFVTASVPRAGSRAPPRVQFEEGRVRVEVAAELGEEALQVGAPPLPPATTTSRRRPHRYRRLRLHSHHLRHHSTASTPPRPHLRSWSSMCSSA